MGDVVTVERVVAGGAGLAHGGDGRVVFVDAALPGETVEVDIVEQRRDFARARIGVVLEASPDRVVAPCPHLAAGCGGCSWQHVAPVAQLALKAEIVRDALRRTARLPDADVRAAGAVSPWAYRTTLRLAARSDGRLGLRRAASHEVVVLDDCPVAHPRLSELLGGVRARTAGEVTLRVSAATGAATALAIAPATRRRGQPPRLDVPGAVAVGRRAALDEDVDGVRLHVSAGSFFQSGPQAAELLADTVRDATGGADASRFVDAYGGVGLFAATVAGPDDAVVLVESSPSSCADARVNLTGRAATIVESRVEGWTPTPAGVVVADPARSGLQRGGADAVARTGAERVVLVSCDPVSLARDAGLLAEHGYALHHSDVVDVFPHTAHVEVVSRFDLVR